MEREGYRVDRKRVRRLVRLMGLVSTALRPNTSLAVTAYKFFPYQLRVVDINRPKQIRCGDIT